MSFADNFNKVMEMKKRGMKTIMYVEWSAEDILEVNPDLTIEEVEEVLNILDRKHDAEVGVNWDVITVVADEVIDKREKV